MDGATCYATRRGDNCPDTMEDSQGMVDGCGPARNYRASSVPNLDTYHLSSNCSRSSSAIITLLSLNFPVHFAAISFCSRFQFKYNPSRQPNLFYLQRHSANLQLACVKHQQHQGALPISRQHPGHS